MKRLGVGFSWREDSVDDIVACARRAEEAGVESVWVPEAWGRDAFLTLAAVAHATERVGLGTGIVNVYSRSPAALAMSSATLDELSKGRAILGVGSSGPGVVERWHGIRYDRPLTRVRETVQIVRLALSGDATDFEGDIFQVHDFKLAMNRPKRRLPILIAALGPLMLRLAGEVADGVLLYLCPLPSIPEAIRHVREGAEKAGRSTGNFDIAALLPTVISQNESEAKTVVAKVIAYYVGGMGTYYSRLLSQTGFASEVRKIKEAWQSGDRRSATDAVNERLVDAVAITGSPNECRRKLDEFRSSGVTLPILSVSSQGPKAAADFSVAIKAITAK